MHTHKGGIKPQETYYTQKKIYTFSASKKKLRSFGSKPFKKGCRYGVLCLQILTKCSVFPKNPSPFQSTTAFFLFCNGLR